MFIMIHIKIKIGDISIEISQNDMWKNERSNLNLLQKKSTWKPKINLIYFNFEIQKNIDFKTHKF
jgi:hypothetical protein